MSVPVTSVHVPCTGPNVRQIEHTWLVAMPHQHAVDLLVRNNLLSIPLQGGYCRRAWFER